MEALANLQFLSIFAKITISWFRCLRQHDLSDELPTSYPRYASSQDCFDACGQSSRCQAVFIWQENHQEKPSCVYMSQACDVNADTCGPADWCLGATLEMAEMAGDYGDLWGITIWLFNIAMEHGPFIDDFPIKTTI